MEKGKLPLKGTTTQTYRYSLTLSVTSNNAMRFLQLWLYLLGNYAVLNAVLLLLTFPIHILKGKIYPS